MQYSTHVTLLTRLKDGVDSDAWRLFHDRYRDVIIGFARRQGLQPGDCEDVLQDVLIALARAMPKFEYDPSRGRFRSYLKTLTIRAAWKKSRQKTHGVPLEHMDQFVECDAADAQLDAVWEEQWRRYHVSRAMQRLESEFNEKDRMAFASYAVEGKSVDETAEALGMSTDQVYKAKSRILKRLGEVIDEQVREEG